MNNFLDNNFDSLIQIYIKERHSNNNEIGVLFVMFQESKVDVKYVPLSNNQISDELREDIISKNETQIKGIFNKEEIIPEDNAYLIPYHSNTNLDRTDRSIDTDDDILYIFFHCFGCDPMFLIIGHLLGASAICFCKSPLH